MNKIIHPFQFPIYSKKLSNSNFLKIKNDVDIFLKNNILTTPINWDCNTLSSVNIPPDKNINSPTLINEIQKSSLEYYKTWEFENNFNLTLFHMWVNIASPGDYQEVHHHIPSLFSGVLYIDCSEKSGNISFSNPLKSEFGLMGIEKKFTITPEIGLLVLFPSWLEHSVFENKSNKNRISISFNINKK